MGWLRKEFERARKRSAQIPDRAKPVVTGFLPTHPKHGNSGKPTWANEAICWCGEMFRTMPPPPSFNDHLDDLVEQWHNTPQDGVPLHEHLGMTWNEYATWTRNPQKLPAHWNIRC